MSIRSLRRAVAAGLVIAALATPFPGSAQDDHATAVADLIVVAPASGPAWWKVSKGDASVWILGLPLNTPEGTKWDQSTLKRRLKGARLMVGLYNESARFNQSRRPPRLPPELKEEVATLSAQLGLNRPAASLGPTADRPDIRLRSLANGRGTVLDLWDLRLRLALSNGICFCTLKEVNEIVRRAGVKRVTPPVNSYTMRASAFGPENPGAIRCLRAMIAELSTPRRRYEAAAALWAKGDVRGMLEIEPPNLELGCEYVWPGSRERTIAFQTSLIAQALDRPGKVIGAARISHLVAKDGILERLRAQGFTIADSSKPLEE